MDGKGNMQLDWIVCTASALMHETLFTYAPLSHLFIFARNGREGDEFAFNVTMFMSPAAAESASAFNFT